MEALECPFKTAKAAQEELAQSTSIIVVDIHAEATSEKVALGWYLDGAVSAVLGRIPIFRLQMRRSFLPGPHILRMSV